jgi:hypothetical protein
MQRRCFLPATVATSSQTGRPQKAHPTNLLRPARPQITNHKSQPTNNSPPKPTASSASPPRLVASAAQTGAAAAARIRGRGGGPDWPRLRLQRAHLDRREARAASSTAPSSFRQAAAPTRGRRAVAGQAREPSTPRSSSLAPRCEAQDLSFRPCTAAAACTVARTTQHRRPPTRNRSARPG